MALTKCRECGKQVSTEARTCPQCGVVDPAGTAAAAMASVMAAHQARSRRWKLGCAALPLLFVGWCTYLQATGPGEPSSRSEDGERGASAQTMDSPSVDRDAVASVAGALNGNKLGVQAQDLLTKPNPKGAGTFVYHPQTRFFGVERYVVWLFLDGVPYPLNGATKGTVTPSLPWPREAPAGLWSTTGLDPYSATEAIAIVFGARM